MTTLFGGNLLAQEATPTPRPVELACDLTALREQQALLAAQLASFPQQAGEDAGVALDALFRVGADYQTLALDCGYIPADFAERAAGEDVERILRMLPELNADPINGQALYNGEFGCFTCHQGENHIGPLTDGTYTRVEETRLADPLLAGYTPEQYLVESIVNPTAYIAPNYQPSMPPIFAKSLTLQQLADILAYLESQDGESPE